jgi:hypothetical protein
VSEQLRASDYATNDHNILGMQRLSVIPAHGRHMIAPGIRVNFGRSLITPRIPWTLHPKGGARGAPRCFVTASVTVAAFNTHSIRIVRLTAFNKV